MGFIPFRKMKTMIPDARRRIKVGGFDTAKVLR